MSRNIRKAGELKSQGKSIKEICTILNRSERMVEYYIKEYKKTVNQEQKLKQFLKKFENSTFQRICLQFVISDIIGLNYSVSLFVFLSLIFNSS